MRIFFAPMEGVVDHHMRHIITSIGGVDVCVTEFVRVNSDVLPKRVFHRYCPELITNNHPLTQKPYGAQCPVRMQLLGSNPEMLAANAQQAVECGAVAIDLNFGCPAKTVNKSKGGACLLDETPLLQKIVSQVRAAVPIAIPVTAKIRLGYDSRESYLDNAKAIEDAGATELCVHARSKVDGYNPPAYWDYIGRIRDALSIPVIANGEIWSVDDFFKCKDQSRCDDFMLGRGLLAKPDLALAIKRAQEKKKFTPFTWAEVLEHVKLFFELTCDAYPEKHMGNRLKQWLFYLKREYPEATLLFENLKRDKTKEILAEKLLRGVDL